jgi:hypothetical protein
MAGGNVCQSRIGAGLTAGHVFLGIIPGCFKAGLAKRGHPHLLDEGWSAPKEKVLTNRCSCE